MCLTHSILIVYILITLQHVNAELDSINIELWFKHFFVTEFYHIYTEKIISQIDKYLVCLQKRIFWRKKWLRISQFD